MISWTAIVDSFSDRPFWMLLGTLTVLTFVSFTKVGVK